MNLSEVRDIPSSITELREIGSKIPKQQYKITLKHLQLQTQMGRENGSSAGETLASGGFR